MNAMRSICALTPILAVVVLASLEAQAQLLPWPTDPRSTPAAAPAAPPTASPAPMASPMQGRPPPQAGGNPPCLEEFTKLRTEADKRAQEAKAGQQRKASREEMCKLV